MEGKKINNHCCLRTSRKLAKESPRTDKHTHRFVIIRACHFRSKKSWNRILFRSKKS